ncbi:MAG TPA: CHASE sensor domain-containing protein, partial [Verrucomicrobiae bacterium]|nr:CHASE sensor domain-containing protein [Verrucomicrobiae bacterium]
MRRWFNDLPIPRKLVLLIAGTSGVASLLLFGLLIGLAVADFKQATIRNAIGMASILSYNSTAALEFDDAGTARDTLNMLQSNPRVLFAAIFRPDGTEFTRYSRNSRSAASDPPLRPEGSYFTEGDLTLYRNVMLNGRQIGTICMLLDLRETRARLWQFVGMISLALVGCAAISVLLSVRLQRIISRPILDLVAVTRTVAEEKNYSLRAKKRGADEIGRLIDGFNEMLGQIQARDAALQQAHDELELRVAERTR